MGNSVTLYIPNTLHPVGCRASNGRKMDPRSQISSNLAADAQQLRMLSYLEIYIMPTVVARKNANLSH